MLLCNGSEHPERRDPPKLYVDPDGLSMQPDELIWHAVGSGMQNSSFRLTRSNMLLVGPAARVEALIVAATGRPSAALPEWQPDLGADGPSPMPETILVRDVQNLDGVQQARLHQAIADWHGVVRVLATAPAPLYPLVVRGTFLEALYYRLNMLCLEPPPAPDAGT